MSGPPIVDYEDRKGAVETPTQKLARKTMAEPFVPLGMLGFFSAVAYGAYAYKYRGGMTTSMYLMRLRVMAQSVVVGAITLGAAYSMFRNFAAKQTKDKK